MKIKTGVFVLYNWPYFRYYLYYGAPCMRQKRTKINSKVYFDMPNYSPERVWNSGKKWSTNFGLIFCQNPKMTISQERLDRFQKYLRSKTLYLMRFYDKKINLKLRPTWTALRWIFRITSDKWFNVGAIGKPQLDILWSMVKRLCWNSSWNYLVYIKNCRPLYLISSLDGTISLIETK